MPAAECKSTDVSQQLKQLAGPKGRSWGFLYSTRIPEDAAADEQPQLKTSGLDASRLGQVRQATMLLLMLHQQAAVLRCIHTRLFLLSSPFKILRCNFLSSEVRCYYCCYLPAAVGHHLQASITIQR
jgi:hypothetical protein